MEEAASVLEESLGIFATRKKKSQVQALFCLSEVSNDIRMDIETLSYKCISLEKQLCESRLLNLL